jgi:hypothetical protein
MTRMPECSTPSVRLTGSWSQLDKVDPEVAPWRELGHRLQQSFGTRAPGR